MVSVGCSPRSSPLYAVPGLNVYDPSANSVSTPPPASVNGVPRVIGLPPCPAPVTVSRSLSGAVSWSLPSTVPLSWGPSSETAGRSSTATGGRLANVNVT